MDTLAGTLSLVDRHLPSLLVSESARRRLRHSASQLPAALSSCVYIECRTDGANAADLIVDVSAEGWAILAGTNPVLRLPDPLRRQPVWSHVEALAQRRIDPHDPLHEALSGAWLEFDLGVERECDRMPTPSVFVDFSESVYRSPSLVARRAPLLHVAHLLGHAMAPAARRAIDDALAALPPRAALLYAGFMCGRDTDAIRLCIAGFSRDELAAYLDTMHWPGDMTSLTALMTSLATDEGGAQDRPAIVHLDLSASFGACIGLEYPLARLPQLRGQLAEGALLDALVRRAFLTSEQRDALVTWPALDKRTMPHQLWPSFLVRRLNHVKLVQDANGVLSVKVYLCAEHTQSIRSRPVRDGRVIEEAIYSLE